MIEIPGDMVYIVNYGIKTCAYYAMVLRMQK